MLTKWGLDILYLENIDIAEFRNGTNEYISNIGIRCTNSIFDIGDVMAEHSISIKIQKGTNEIISVWDGDKLIVDNLEINKLEGDDYGPIISHISHYCPQESYFTFSDIRMSNVS